MIIFLPWTNSSVHRGNSACQKDGQTLNNRWILPYNPYLSKKYRSHNNFEACSSVKVCIYLFKCIYKGNNHAMACNAPANKVPPEACNEISEYQDLRSIGASEACWRLFNFPISSRSPPVIALPVHLEDDQLVHFGQGQARQIAAGPPPKTPLTDWFQYNREHPNDTQHYLYCNFPEHFVWDARDTHWKTRQRNAKTATLGRVHSVHPSAGELYFFRILRHHEQSRAQVSWEDVCKVKMQLSLPCANKCTNFLSFCCCFVTR